MYDEQEEMAWQKFREEAFSFAKNRDETVIKMWLNEIGYTDPVGYYRNSWKREMEIYATRLGCLIGKAGTDINKFKKMLNEEFGGEWEVKLVEVRGGFVQI